MGPLSGIKVLEIASIGPGPFCAMMMSDLGAEVVRIDRKDQAGKGDPRLVLNRGRKSLAVDLKNTDGVEALLRMVEKADVLIEGFRPGVMERLGLGPEICMARNQRLIYGRMTGWGQSGPLAHAAGHDINYISLAGALHAMGEANRPPSPPLNLVGDFGGGGMYLLCGILAAIIERTDSGLGQIIDAAMVDGTASLMAAFYGLKAMGRWTDKRESNYLDGGAHYYGTYACADGKFISIGSIEPQFYKILLEKCEVQDPAFINQNDQVQWPELKKKLTALFNTRTRDEWCGIMEGTDICFAPVLDLTEAPEHPHLRTRQTFVESFGVIQPAPAPRFSRTPGTIQGPVAKAGEHNEEILGKWGFDKDEIAHLISTEAI